MEFSWTTFFLEIINFLILVWILKRFFYKPIKKVITERKEALQKNLSDATKLQNEAEALKEKYENRLQDWEKEKDEKLTQLNNEINEEKKQRQTALENNMKKEQEQMQAREENKITNLIFQKEKEAKQAGIKFAATILRRIADSHLENQIFNLFLEKLPILPQQQISAMKKELANNEITIHVKSAFSLDETQKAALTSTFEKIIGECKYVFEASPDLIAGLQTFAYLRGMKNCFTCFYTHFVQDT